jgi:anti-sigma regulatory factor (Ser/Thr protein kinase)
MARRFVRDAVERLDREIDIEAAVLLADELVTNVIQHTHSSGIDLLVEEEADGVRVGVHDDEGALPERRSVDSDELSGRGLTLVERLARRWGVDRAEDGKVTWFCLGPVVGG